MQNSEMEKSGIEKAGQDLFDFAVDREDVRTLLEYLPEKADVSRSKVEYELRLLRIISVGWSVSYYLQSHPRKNQLAELYWKAVYNFSQSISSTAELMIGQHIDYFQILRERLDAYVHAVGLKPDALDPAVAIGPEFARSCGNANDVHTVMTGSKMFIASIGGVKEYLEAIKMM